MSSVLFIPEIAVLLVLSLVGLPIMAVLTINGVLNLVALYAALRFTIGSRAAALAAFGAFAALAMLESTASRESIELASLMATTTYYSSTVVGVVLTVGLLLRRAGRPLATAAVGAIALFCTVSNPIYIAWASLPLVLLLIAGRHLPVRARLLGMGALAVGSALGLLLRVPLAPWIANTGAGYAQPTRWEESLGYYGDLVADRAGEALGILSLLVLLALLLLGVVLTVVGIRRRAWDVAAMATVSWAVPLIVGVGAVALGTHAARYLQPAVFLPVLALGALVTVLGEPHRLVLPAAAVVLAAVAGALLPALAQVASQRHPNDDVACATGWVADSGRIGAGQFWSVRAPKTYADDPAQLVQVDFQLGSYEWLVNRTDFDVGAVSFLLTDDTSIPFELPAGVDVADADTVSCGRYTILDFGEPILPLGPPHS